MGLVYKVIPSELKELSEVVCDRCDKRIQVTMGHWNRFGDPFSFYFPPYSEEEYITVSHHFGFFSNQKDGQRHESVLCEACYDIVFKDIKAKITESI